MVGFIIDLANASITVSNSIETVAFSQNLIFCWPEVSRQNLENHFEEETNHILLSYQREVKDIAQAVAAGHNIDEMVDDLAVRALETTSYCFTKVWDCAEWLRNVSVGEIIMDADISNQDTVAEIRAKIERCFGDDIDEEGPWGIRLTDVLSFAQHIHENL